MRRSNVDHFEGDRSFGWKTRFVAVHEEQMDMHATMQYAFRVLPEVPGLAAMEPQR